MYQYLGSTELLLYDVMGIIMVFALLFFNLSQLKSKKLFLSKYAQGIQTFFTKRCPNAKFNLLTNSTFWAICETIFISFVQYYPITIINWQFGKLVGTGANYFGYAYAIPFIMLLVCFLMRIEPLKQIDLITPSLAFALVFAKIGCFCAGCCNGIECSFGFYNHDTGLIEFPVQLVEAALALLIFLFLLQWRKRAKLGTMFPTYLIIYSGTRFFSEFFRAEPNVFGILKTYHILCIIGVIVGIVELLLVLKFGDRINKFDIRNIFKR